MFDKEIMAKALEF